MIVIIPVGVIQVGCVVTDAVGAVGVVGCVSITTSDEDNETHVEAFVTI